MVHQRHPPLDSTFAALADPSRRGVLERLGQSDATVTELATGFGMTLTGMKKHIGVLERVGLVATQKVGRVRTCRLGPARLAEETAWLDRYQQLWTARFGLLDDVLTEMKIRASQEEGHGKP